MPGGDGGRRGTPGCWAGREERAGLIRGCDDGWTRVLVGRRWNRLQGPRGSCRAATDCLRPGPDVGPGVAIAAWEAASRPTHSDFGLSQERNVKPGDVADQLAPSVVLG